MRSSYHAELGMENCIEFRGVALPVADFLACLKTLEISYWLFFPNPFCQWKGHLTEGIWEAGKSWGLLQIIHRSYPTTLSPCDSPEYHFWDQIPPHSKITNVSFIQQYPVTSMTHSAAAIISLSMKPYRISWNSLSFCLLMTWKKMCTTAFALRKWTEVDSLHQWEMRSHTLLLEDCFRATRTKNWPG